MNITYFGHSTFLFETQNIKLLTDPCKLIMHKVKRKNIVDKITHITMSHQHFDHSYINDFQNELTIINTQTDYDSPVLKIWAYNSYHDNCRGFKRGENIIFKYYINGITLCHLGDLGHQLSPETIDALGKIDVLFIPVGGNVTLDGLAACNVVNSLQPKIAVPMHYKTPEISLPIDGLETFLYRIDLPIKHKSSLQLTQKKLKEMNTHITILSY